MPRDLPDKPGTIALYSLMEYGRWGWFPTFEETTEYRLCLNGVTGRFPPAGENALLPVLRAVEASDGSATRQRLLDELRGRKLYFAFSIPEEVRKRGAITADTPIQFVQHDWDGEPCFFVYTDPAFRIEPLQGCVAIEAVRIARLLRRRMSGLVWSSIQLVQPPANLRRRTEVARTVRRPNENPQNQPLHLTGPALRRFVTLRLSSRPGK